MNKDQVIATLREHQDELRLAGADRLYLFGSVARGEERPGSDIDLFFDVSDSRFSLIELVYLQDRLNTILGTKSDLMTRASIHPLLRSQIEAEAVPVF